MGAKKMADEKVLAKVTVGRQAFLDNLSTAKKTSGGSKKLAVLNYALVTIKNKVAVISATNLETAFVNVLTDAPDSDPLIYDTMRVLEIKKPDARVLINIDKVLKIVKKFSKSRDRITLEVCGSDERNPVPWFRIDGKFTLLDCMNPDDYPVIPHPHYTRFYPAMDYDALNLINIGVWKDETRAHLKSILFDRENGYYACTDGSRLHLHRMPPVTGLKQILFPKAALELLNSPYLKKARTDLVCMDKTGVFVYMLLETGFVCSRLYDGDFPKYMEVIDSDLTSILSMSDKSKLVELLAEAQAIGDGSSYQGLIMSFNGSFNITATNPDLGEYCHDVPAEVYSFCGNDGKTMMNPSHLIDGINLVPSKGVNIYFTCDYCGPAIIETPDRSIVAAVMPMRLE